VVPGSVDLAHQVKSLILSGFLLGLPREDLNLASERSEREVLEHHRAQVLAPSTAVRIKGEAR